MVACAKYDDNTKRLREGKYGLESKTINGSAVDLTDKSIKMEIYQGGSRANYVGEGWIYDEMKFTDDGLVAWDGQNIFKYYIHHGNDSITFIYEDGYEEHFTLKKKSSSIILKTVSTESVFTFLESAD